MSETDVNALIERLKERTVTIGQTTYVVAEGDLLLDEEELLPYAIRRAGVTQVVAGGELPDPLLVMSINGLKVRWAKGLVLSYAVLRGTFPDEGSYHAVVNNMEAATSAWEGACGVNFRHMPELDTTANGQGALFTVQYVDAYGEFIAAAFFPTWAPAKRIVYIDPSYFSPNLRFNKVGVLRHELGHVLGFRHEHIRSGAPPNCPGESLANTTPLSDYDPQSVMHYFCGGVGTKELALTRIDRESAQALYGPPDREITYFT